MVWGCVRRHQGCRLFWWLRRALRGDGVVLHKLIVRCALSLEGRVKGFGVDMGVFYGVAMGYRPDAFLVGSNTVKMARNETIGKNYALLVYGTLKYDTPSRKWPLPEDIRYLVVCWRLIPRLPIQAVQNRPFRPVV